MREYREIYIRLRERLDEKKEDETVKWYEEPNLSLLESRQYYDEVFHVGKNDNDEKHEKHENNQ